MKYVWDNRKNESNLDKQSLAFNDVIALFESDAPFLVDYDDRFLEERWIGIGLLNNHAIVVVYTEPDKETVRIISARLADKYEEKRYFETFRK